MKHLLSIRTISLLAIIGALVFSSCVPQKKMLLLKELLEILLLMMRLEKL